MKPMHSDSHEPAANVITLVVTVIMLAGVFWWASRQVHHDSLRQAQDSGSGGSAARP